MTKSARMRPDVAHVWPGDDKFKARMRFHQSWYREHRKGLEPGTNSSSTNKDALFGNRLKPEDGDAGRNFLTLEIARVVKERIRQDKSLASWNAQSRLLCDMLSSQPMCFNLFGPLVVDLDLATSFIRALRGVPSDLTVIGVALEYAPDDQASHLDDRTSHDAFVEYVRPGGVRGFIGIETKLTEPFTQFPYQLTKRYRSWIRKSDSWWREDSEEHFSTKLYNQLWRNHLLVLPC